MEFEFGYSHDENSNNANHDGNGGNVDNVTNLSTGKIEHTEGGEPAEDVNERKDDDVNNNNNKDKKDTKDGNDKDSHKEDNKDNDKKDDTNKFDLEEGTVISVGKDNYTVDSNGNVVDANGNIFKEASQVNDWLNELDRVEETDETITIDAIKDSIGINITDENDKPIEFENNIEGIKSYVQAVIETSRAEQQEAAINALYQRYPILNDVLNYYIANGNSLEGFGEVPDRRGITIDDSNEEQQESIIRTAWKERGNKGNVESYIQYLKSSGTLLAAAKEELESLQEADETYRKSMEEEAERIENERIEKLKKYWNGVHDIVKSRKIAGYQIPESIIINKNGQKLSVTPEDFFDYMYKVDGEGKSAYQRDLAKQSAESRRDDEILRAYLTFVGGNYSNLVSMAINKEKVNTLRFNAKKRSTSTARITKPNNTNKNNNMDFGY